MQAIGTTSLSGASLGNTTNGSPSSGGSAAGRTSVASRLAEKAAFELRADRSNAARESRPDHEKGHFKRTAKGVQRAHSLFRAEIMQRFKFKFAASLNAQAALPASYQGNDSAGDVAAGILMSASQALMSGDIHPQETMATIRQSVGDAASMTKAHVEDGAESIAVGETVGMVNKGLDVLQQRITTMTASEINIESRSKQRTSIRIRTQEGDVVRFDLRNVSRMSLSDKSLVTDSESASMTELKLSSNSRLRIMVKGDLNEAELEAVRSVFAAAEKIANEFFSGDLSAALEIAAGLEIDAQQLARVSMGFRSSTRISASQTLTQSGPAPIAPPVSADEVTAPDGPAIVPGPQTDADTVEQPEPPKPAPTTEPVPVENRAAEDPATPTLLSGFGRLADYLGILADFLEQTATRFSGDTAGDSLRTSMRIDFKQSFQLEILRSVMSVIATDHGVQEKDTDGSTIQRLADSIDEPAARVVASE